MLTHALNFIFIYIEERGDHLRSVAPNIMMIQTKDKRSRWGLRQHSFHKIKKSRKKILIIIKEREILKKDPFKRKTNMKPIKAYNVN